MVINTTVYARIMAGLGGCILCTILVAGLWPFHAPRNHVAWRENSNGLRFGRFGSVLSSGAFHGQPSQDSSAGSLEIWLAPSLGSQRTILSFDGSDHPGIPFSLLQHKDGLIVYRYNLDEHGTAWTAWCLVNGVFRNKKSVFVTVTLGKRDTSVYVDGVLAKVSPILGASTNNITGRVVLGNSATFNDSWSGKILGLAMYQRQLGPAQVAQHYESWTKDLQPALAQDESPVALYLFKEGRGSVVRNEVDPATSLTIPDRYFVLHPRFLSSPQHEYHATWGYWEDIAVNIAGFIPLGAWAVVYFSSVRVVKSPAVIAILMGFSTSVTIEVLQSFLPTRSSGMTDIITNTLGTVIGVMLCRWSVVQGWLIRVRQYGNQADPRVTTRPELETVYSD